MIVLGEEPVSMKKANHHKVIFGLTLLISFFFFRGGEGLSQTEFKEEQGPEIRLGEVTVQIREIKSTPPLKLLEIQIEVKNQSQEMIAPPNSIKLVATPKEVKSLSKKTTSEFPFTSQESILELPLPPKTGRVMIFGYTLPEAALESITFEIQINPPEGEIKTVTWEGI
jgi:hypothetical protein